MKGPHPLQWWVTLWLWVAIGLPPVAGARAMAAELPEGVCGSPQVMLEAAQAGNAMVQQALSRGMRWRENSLNEYVNRLGQNLARSSGSQQVFSFYVLYNPEPNAQSFPGGSVVINSGAISLAATEAELAAVLSHEIAHENACDWRTVPRRANLLQLFCIFPAVFFGGPAGIALVAGGGWASTLARARFSRAKEQRADHLAALYLARAGYDPQAAAQFFQRLQADKQNQGGEAGGLLATHPPIVERERSLEKIIPTLPPRETILHNETEFLQMRRAVREYDAMYARLVGVHVPGQDAPAPVLSRRAPPATSP